MADSMRQQVNERSKIILYNYCLGRRKRDNGAVGEAVFNFDNCIATAWGLVMWVLTTRLSLAVLMLRVGRLDLASSDVWVETESVEGVLGSGSVVCGSSWLFFADCSFCRRTICSLIMSESESISTVSNLGVKTSYQHMTIHFVPTGTNGPSCGRNICRRRCELTNRSGNTLMYY